MTLINDFPPTSEGCQSRLSRRLFVAGSLAAMTLPASARTKEAAAPPRHFAPRELPARTLPVPGTVSPALQAHIARPYPPGWNVIPQTAAAWKKLAAQSAAGVAPSIAAIRQRLGLEVEARQIAGVGVFVITPDDLPAANRDRVLLHIHGGGYVLYPGEPVRAKECSWLAMATSK